MRFLTQEYWSGQEFPSPGDFPDLGIKPGSPAFQAASLPSEPPGKQIVLLYYFHFFLHLLTSLIKITLWNSGKL